MGLLKWLLGYRAAQSLVDRGRSNEEGECHLCGDKVIAYTSGMLCTQCGAFAHPHCLKENGYLEKKGLLGGRVYLECPKCGHDATYSKSNAPMQSVP
ncbi:MAG: hypothetical protein SXQ77_12970 [Halobacteria archaeon]|nr:hypothetical protein [Halobacteria archaeon]